MEQYSIDGATIEPIGSGYGKGRWMAHRNGVSSTNQLTPMLAYMLLLRREAEQFIFDLKSEYEETFNCYDKMRADR